jgi:hypothetical protein
MAIERLTADAQLFAQVGDDRASLAHGGLRKTELGRRHLRLAATVASARAGGCESGDRAFPDQLELELRERREDAEHQFAGRGRGVDCGSLSGQHAQSDAAGIEVMHDVNEVAQVATETIELPDDKGIARAHRFKTRVEAGTIVLLAARGVAVDVALGNAGNGERDTRM